MEKVINRAQVLYMHLMTGEIAREWGQVFAALSAVGETADFVPCCDYERTKTLGISCRQRDQLYTVKVYIGIAR